MEKKSGNSPARSAVWHARDLARHSICESEPAKNVPAIMKCRACEDLAEKSYEMAPSSWFAMGGVSAEVVRIAMEEIRAVEGFRLDFVQH